LALAEIAESGSIYTVRGKPGDKVRMIVNDAPHYFGDNRGSFAVTIVRTP
jgi:hypothetical protein